MTRIRAYLLPHDPNKLSHGYPCTIGANCNNNSSNGVGGGTQIRYGFNSTRFQLMPLPVDEEDSSMIQHLLAKETPLYEETWPVLNPFVNETIACKFSKGAGVVANVVTVELIGKHVEQTPGGGYYACVDSLDCEGIPLNTDAPGVLRS